MVILFSGNRFPVSYSWFHGIICHCSIES